MPDEFSKAKARAKVGHHRFRCDMCGGVFPKEVDDDAMKSEAINNGFDFAEPMAVVCDGCYARLGLVPLREEG